MSKRLRDALKGVGTYKNGKYVPKKEEKKKKPLTGKMKKMGDTDKTVPTKSQKPTKKPTPTPSPTPRRRPSPSPSPSPTRKPVRTSTRGGTSSMAQGGTGGRFDKGRGRALGAAEKRLSQTGNASLGTPLTPEQRRRREQMSSPEAMGSSTPTKNQKTNYKGASRSRKSGRNTPTPTKPPRKRKYKGASLSRKR